MCLSLLASGPHCSQGFCLEGQGRFRSLLHSALGNPELSCLVIEEKEEGDYLVQSYPDGICQVLRVAPSPGLWETSAPCLWVGSISVVEGWLLFADGLRAATTCPDGIRVSWLSEQAERQPWWAGSDPTTQTDQDLKFFWGCSNSGESWMRASTSFLEFSGGLAQGTLRV